MMPSERGIMCTKPASGGSGLPAPVVLAHVASESADCEWSLDQHSEAPRDTICSGDMIRVARGKIQLSYNNGTVLTLHGPALFEVISDMRGRALLGRLTAKIGKGAEGFSVLTPRATVIDLGTELGIEVDDAGATDVVGARGVSKWLMSLRSVHRPHSASVAPPPVERTLQRNGVGVQHAPTTRQAKTDARDRGARLGQPFGEIMAGGLALDVVGKRQDQLRRLAGRDPREQGGQVEVLRRHAPDRR